MKFNQLKVTRQSAPKRLGRGIASGKGKTAGRGTKGQKARTGSSAKPGFAGGSNPLMQKLPKLPGFHSHKAVTETVYTAQLGQFANKTVDATLLAEAGLISNAFVRVKLLSKGDLTKKVSVKLAFASAPAVAVLEASGGTFEKTARLQRPKTTARSRDKTKPAPKK
jgi:large subunit ribosomal protein L15